MALPVAGLVGILKSGRALSAPFSVDGVWKIESTHPSASLCGSFLTSVSNLPITISQSGKTLVVAVAGGAKTTTGIIDGKMIKAQFAASDRGVAECGDRSLTVTATLDPVADPRTLTGTLSIEGCGSCAPLEFRAARQPRSPGGTR